VAAGAEPAAMGQAERGWGQGGERARVVDHRGRHALVGTGESSAEEVEGVSGVAVRAGRADRLPAVAARGHHRAGARDQDRAVAVEHVRAAAQVDRSGAAARGLHLGTPLSVVGVAQTGGIRESVASAGRSGMSTVGMSGPPM
jgi:hypothetical protein